MKKIIIILVLCLCSKASATIEAMIKFKHPYADTTEIKADTVITDSIVNDVVVFVDTTVYPIMISERGTIVQIKPAGSEWGNSVAPPHFIIVEVSGIEYSHSLIKYYGYTLDRTTIQSIWNKHLNGTLNIVVDTFMYNGSMVTKKRRLKITKQQMINNFHPQRYYPTE